ncbi:GNAT family N-acetyltransferase [Streptomyces sp. NPDC057137]|uniref:GNAT family N-acetyltransferase n=1 Tax=Streptomyces sp. NPDC057137 TaxID=3346030 RepID=UPI00362DE698
MTELVTERLLLHPLSPSEAVRLVTGDRTSGSHWAPGYPDEGDVSGATRFLTTCEGIGDPRPFGTYEIRVKETGQAVGGVDFHGPPDETGSVTIGYGLVPAARGKGYASEALRGLLLFARAVGVTSVRGDTDHDNVGSQHVMAAAGMRLIADDGRLKFYEIAWPGPEPGRDTARNT